MTNNPDKIRGFQDIGFQISKVESIEVNPSPFNQSYLVSKEKVGHLLYKTKTKISKYKVNFEKITPFIPYELDKFSRFIHCATYFLPIKPVNNLMEFMKDELLENMFQNSRPENLQKVTDNKYLYIRHYFLIYSLNKNQWFLHYDVIPHH